MSENTATTKGQGRRHASYESESESMGLLQAAFYLKMHPSYVRNLVVDSTIVGTKDERGHWTVTKEALDNYVAEKAMGSEKVPGEKASYGYVPANVSSCRRVIKLVSGLELPEENKSIVLDVLNGLLADAVAAWEAAKAAKAAEAEAAGEDESEA